MIGYGLVVGLDGTGDKTGTEFTVQSLTNLLSRQGIRVQPDQVRVQNVAAVMITADLPPFGRPGQKIDVLVSSVGDCKSLQGGTLLFTPLKGADDNVYAIAQGPVSIGGFNVGTGGGGSSVQKNHVTVGRIPGGAVLEKTVPTDILEQGVIRFLLNHPDYATAVKIQNSINKTFELEDLAVAIDPGTIEVRPLVLGKDFKSPVNLVAKIEKLEVETDIQARVVINERTGAVIVGGDVNISTVAISIGGLGIEISSTTKVSQPNPFAAGETVVSKDQDITVSEAVSPLELVGGATIKDLVDALNRFKLSSRDMISIFQALKEAGALKAELVIM